MADGRRDNADRSALFKVQIAAPWSAVRSTGKHSVAASGCRRHKGRIDARPAIANPQIPGRPDRRSSGLTLAKAAPSIRLLPRGELAVGCPVQTQFPHEAGKI